MKMMMTAEEAIQWLEKAVETQGPEFRYNPLGAEGPPCSYVKNPDAPKDCPTGKTGCLVGVAMVLAGRMVAVHHNDHDLSSGLRERWSLTPLAADVLLIAQRKQDRGSTWGEALQAAIDLYREYHSTRIG